MEEKTKRSKFSIAIRWVLWILIVQFILINISAAWYAYNLTYFYDPPAPPQSSSKNIFVKTWHLFRGPKYFRSPVTKTPSFYYESVQLYTKNKTLIDGWYMPVDSSKGTVIIIHGLGVNKRIMLNYAEAFHNMKWSVMMIDLRAHGNSGGHISTFGINETEEIKLAYDYVSNKGEKNIILYGSSLGAVVIVKSIYDHNLAVKGIVLDIPFASLHHLFWGQAKILGFPSEPFGTLVTFWAGLERGFNGFNHKTTRYVKKIHCPVLLQYGANDKFVSKQETESIFTNIASSQKKLVEYENAGHDFFLRNDPAKWKLEIEEFLSEIY